MRSLRHNAIENSRPKLRNGGGEAAIRSSRLKTQLRRKQTRI